MISKFSGRCKGCGKPYAAGEEIYWTREEGAFHPGCRSEQQGTLVDNEAIQLAEKLGFKEFP